MGTDTLASDYVHLHVHSDYSLLDGAVKVKSLVNRAAKLKMRALALTDHGNLCGAIDLYTQCKKAGIKPIVGMEAYVTLEGSHRDRRPGYNHLTLLTRSPQGYKNLVALSSISHKDGFYYRPRIDKDLLAEYSEGIICLSGCLRGEISQHLIAGDADKARAAAGWYTDVFGDDFYLEIQPNGLDDQVIVNTGSLRLGKSLNLPVVASCDLHYLDRSDADSQDIKICIGSGKVLSDPNRLEFKVDEFYFKTGAEVVAAFRDNPEVISRSREIAEKCEPSIPELEGKSEFYLPNFEPPGDTTPEAYFEKLCNQGVQQRYGDNPAPEVRKRLNDEMEVIRTLEGGAFVHYFLIVSDFIRWAKRQGIPVGPGRGSAAGSLVSYCLEITDLDPLRYDLLFERFLNPGRVSMPDIDVDFCERRRELVINYVRNKYGRDSVSKIITFGKLKAKAAVRDVGRVMEIPLSEVDRLAKTIPGGPKQMDLATAIRTQPALQDEIAKNPRNVEWMRRAQGVEGLYRNASTHAAGILISDKPLLERIPLYRHSSTDELSTQYTMAHVESIGLLKMDFLGLRTLTVIDDTLQTLARDGVKVDLANIDVAGDDESVKGTYEMLARGDTLGVFQLDSAGFRDVLVKMKPDRFEDIIALLALYRPGPMDYIPTFIARKHGREPVQFAHPDLEPILAETFGVFLYQEQVMRTAQRLANFTLPEADNLRKAMGKKIPEAMETYRAKFVEGAGNKGVSKETADSIWSTMAEFAKYAFNKSHSAAYGMVTWYTAWLKCNHPAPYMASLLTSEAANTDNLMKYLGECRRLGINILPPDVNESAASFTVIKPPNGNGLGNIRFGLGAIKGLGSRAIESILAGREKTGNKFSSIWAFCESIDHSAVNRSALDALIKAGAFDSTGAHRAQLTAVMEPAMASGRRLAEDRKSGQGSLFGGHGGDLAGAAEPPEPPLPEMSPWPASKQLAGEKLTLGFYISGHPLDPWRCYLDTFSTAHTLGLKDKHDGANVTVGAIITQLKIATDKRGNPYARMVLEDLHGTVEAIAFNRVYADCRSQLVEESLVFVTGKLQLRGDRDEDEDVRATILVDQVHSFLDAPSAIPVAVDLSLDIAQTSLDLISDVRQALSRSPGESPLEITFKGTDGRTLRTRSSKYRVRVFDGIARPGSDTADASLPSSQLKSDLETLAGVGCVKIRAQPTRWGGRR